MSHALNSCSLCVFVTIFSNKVGGINNLNFSCDTFTFSFPVPMESVPITAESAVLVRIENMSVVKDARVKDTSSTTEELIRDGELRLYLTIFLDGWIKILMRL